MLKRLKSFLLVVDVVLFSSSDAFLAAGAAIFNATFKRKCK